MAWTSAQRTVFSSMLSAYIQKNLVFKNAVNYKWEPEAIRSKVVTINRLGAITVGTYVADMAQISSSAPVFTSQNLTLDQYKYFNVPVDDILYATTNIELFRPIAEKGGYELAQVQDAAIAAQYTNFTTVVSASSSISSSVLVSNGATETATTASAYDWIINLQTKLDENHVPSTNRYCIAPSWFVNMVAKDDRFASFDQSVRQYGVMGSIADMTVLKSENIQSVGDGQAIMALHQDAISFATGLENLEQLRSTTNFSTYIRALAVYGIKTVEPTYGAILYARTV